MIESADKFMQRAIELAQLAEEKGEVPIGAVLVLENKIIGEGWNQPISSADPTSHAEIVALRQGAKKVGNYRLVNTILYVTLQPCMMCVGALVHARVKKVFYGAARLNGVSELNHVVEYEDGVLAEDCGQMLKRFFEDKRK